MAGYIGSRASVVSSGAERKKTFDITGTTTVLTGLSYTPTFVHLFHNGVRLVDGTDYTATNGTSITLTTAAENGDQVVVVSYATFQAADAYTKAETYTKAEADAGFVSDPNGVVTVDGSGNVGIGTAVPSELLEIEDGNMLFTNTVSNDSRIYFTHTTTPDRRSYIGALETTGNGNALIFAPNVNGVDAAEAVRIDDGGNLLVGTTAYTGNTTNSGGGIREDGLVFGSTPNGAAGLFNRLTSDGDIALFRKNGTTVGGIGTYVGFLTVGGGDVGLLFQPASNSIHPWNFAANTQNDNFMDLGQLVNRWDDIYATNGTIQTSDRNEKEAIASLTPAEMLVAARLSCCFKNFKWKDSVAEKGLEAARMHSGIIAQDVQDAFAAEGLDASDYAMFISGTWWEAQTDVPAVEAVAEVVDEEGNVVTEAVEAKDAYTRTDTYHTLEEAPEGATERTRLGVRYPELLAFVAAYNDQRFLTIEARLTALEATP